MEEERIREQRIKVVTGQKMVRVNGNSIVAEDAEGRKEVIREDMVVLALGMKPNKRKRLMEDLKGKISELHRIGDYKKPGGSIMLSMKSQHWPGKFSGVIWGIGGEAI